MMKLLSIVGLAIASIQGADAVQCAVTVQLGGNYMIDPVGLNAYECGLFKITLNRAFSQSVDQMDAGLAAAGIPLKSGAFLAPGCPAAAGYSSGPDCHTLTAANGTIFDSGYDNKIAKSHVLLELCMNNQYYNDKILKAIADGPATAPFNSAATGIFQMVTSMCGNPAFPAIPCGFTGVSFGNQKVACCEAAAVLAANKAHAAAAGTPPATGANHTAAIIACPSHSTTGGCLNGTTNPTAKALTESLTLLKDDGCTCGKSVMTNITTHAYLKTMMEEDNPECTTTTTTTTAAPSAANGLMVSFTSVLAAIVACFF